MLWARGGLRCSPASVSSSRCSGSTSSAIGCAICSTPRARSICGEGAASWFQLKDVSEAKGPTMFLQEYGERWLEVDGIRTRYFEAGSGRTIVLVHGGTKGDASGGANAEDFHLNFAELARKFRVISVDRIGQGYTDNPKRDEDWTMAAAVRHMAGFLKALGYAPYNLVGHSRGGYVVARVTMDYPRLVESCILIDSNTASPGPGRNEIVFALNPYKAGTLEASRWTYEKYSCTTQHVTDEWIAMKQKITVSEKN